jgi:hypothetical protein
MIHEIMESEGVECIWDLDLLESRDEHSRLALSDGENSVWVCEWCEELHDPDDGVCECSEFFDEDDSSQE